jgi:hypothetical protein
MDVGETDDGAHRRSGDRASAAPPTTVNGSTGGGSIGASAPSTAATAATAAATAAWGKPSTIAASASTATTRTLASALNEPVNCKAIEDLADYPSLRRMKLRNGDYLMRVLADLWRRSKDGRIAVVWRAGGGPSRRSPQIVQDEARRSGLNRIAAIPPESVRRNPNASLGS